MDLPNPDELKHQVRARLRELAYQHGNPVLIRVLGQIAADQALLGLHDLSANLLSLKADEPGVFDDVGLALMAAGTPSLNRTQQRQLYDKQTFRSAREVGRWLCERRLGLKLDPPTDYFPGQTFDQAADGELQRLGEELEQPNVGDQVFLTKLLETVADPRSTSLVCFAIAVSQLKARKFKAAVTVAMTAYESSFDHPATWSDCARFMSLVTLASAENLIANDLPDWGAVMLVGEAADLATVPRKSVDAVVAWVWEGDQQQRAQLFGKSSNTPVAPIGPHVGQTG
jgi:hypothetical protein